MVILIIGLDYYMVSNRILVGKFTNESNYINCLDKNLEKIRLKDQGFGE
jgi:hypothetical protein